MIWIQESHPAPQIIYGLEQCEGHGRSVKQPATQHPTPEGWVWAQQQRVAQVLGAENRDEEPTCQETPAVSESAASSSQARSMASLLHWSYTRNAQLDIPCCGVRFRV